MSYHFGAGEYNHLIGRKVGELLIVNIKYDPDSVYIMTDGHAGKPHLLFLCNGETFQFRQFQEVVDKYGSLKLSEFKKDVSKGKDSKETDPKGKDNGEKKVVEENPEICI